MYSKKILFVGMPDMAIVCLTKLIAAGINIVGVVPPHPQDQTYELMCSVAKGFRLPIIAYQNNLDEIDFLHKIRQLNADLAVVCSYGKKFPPEFLKTVKDGFVNCHPSLLPEYRGANPYSHVIMNNEKQTGVTLHFMDENFDTGNIIAQQAINIDTNETMGTLFNKLNYVCADFLTAFLERYETLNKIPNQAQPDGIFKKAPSINAQNLKSFINWNKDAQYIERFIRALNPFISATTNFRGIFTKIHSATALNKKTKHEPGTICNTKETLDISTGNGILQIKSLQFGSYMISDAKEFIEMFKPQIGEKLGR